MRQVILYPGEDGWWVAEIPSLPGCVTQGRSKQEALENASEAAQVWMEAAKELGRPIPQDRGGAEIVELPRLAS